MAKQTTPTTIDQVFSRMAAAILECNDECPDDEHATRMRRVVLDHLELGKRRVADICSK